MTPNSRRRVTAASFAAIGLMMTMQPAAAQDLGAFSFAQDGLRACGGDISRICSNVAPGGGRIAQCLLAQEDSLSVSCRDFAAAMRQAQGVILACSVDAERLCPGVVPGGGRVVTCLTGKRELLSRDCARGLEAAGATFAR